MTNHLSYQSIVNCVEERTLFSMLLSDVADRKTDYRILTIKAEGAKGKTTLIHHYEHMCKSANPSALVSVVNLKQSVISSINQIILQIADDFEPHLIFQELTKIRKEWQLGKSSGNYDIIRNLYREKEAFIGSPRKKKKQQQNSLSTQIDAKYANFTGASDTQFITNQNNFFEVPPMPQANENELELERLYLDLCEHYFLYDLHRYLKRSKQKKSIVILFDTYEQTNSEVKLWLEKKFFPHLMEIKRNINLIVVIAGQDIPNFENNHSQELCKKHIKNLTLSSWKSDDIIELAKKYNRNPDVITPMMNLLQQRKPGELVAVFDILLRADN